FGEYTEWSKALPNKASNTFSVDEGTWYSIHDDIFTADNWGKPSSAEVYEQTRKALEAQGIDFAGGRK
ncbi:MAG: hypothetical protein IJL80_11520, partial [Treponema sp.]|nr:hypothetical protein [Treponema sp.]